MFPSMCLRLPLLASMLALLPVAAVSAELKGKVTAVDGNEVRLSIDGDLLPQPGDEVTLSFEVPDLPPVRVGTWKVRRIDGVEVVATVVDATGQPAVGQTAAIASANPRPRATQPAPPPGVLWLVPPPRRGMIGVAFERDGTIVEVLPDSPAEHAGLRAGDIVTHVEDAPFSADDFKTRLVSMPPEGTVRIRVTRAGVTHQLTVSVPAIRIGDVRVEVENGVVRLTATYDLGGIRPAQVNHGWRIISGRTFETVAKLGDAETKVPAEAGAGGDRVERTPGRWQSRMTWRPPEPGRYAVVFTVTSQRQEFESKQELFLVP